MADVAFLRPVRNGVAVRLRSVGSPVAWAATVVFVATMVLWTIVTPAFRSPDEPQHVNSVLRLAEGGGWPAPGEAFVSDEVLRAKTLSGFSGLDGALGNWDGGTLLPGVRPDIAEQDLMYFALYSAQEVTPGGARPAFRDLTLTHEVDSSAHPDQMTQHPPLYYGLTAAILKATGADDWRFDRTLTLMRWVSVLLVAPLPLLAYSVAVRLSGRRRVGDLAAVLPLAIPQLGSLGGGVTNDSLVVCLGGVLVLLLARVLTGDRSWRTTVGIGLVLGLGLLTKGLLLIAVPVVGLALVLAGRRAPTLPWRRTLLGVGVAWGIAFAVGGWWWALNLLRYGTVQPAGWGEQFAATFVVDGPRDSLPEFAVQFSERFSTSFWGSFGWLELPLPLPLVVVLTAGLLVGVASAFRRRGDRLAVGVLLALPLLMLALLFPATYDAHLYNGQYGGMQGRYLYGGLVAVLAAAAVGIGTSVRAGGRAERWVPSFALVLGLAIAAYGLWLAFRGYYVDVDWTLAEGWQRMVAWSPWPGWVVAGVAVGVVATALVAVAVAVGSAVRSRTGDAGQGIP